MLKLFEMLMNPASGKKNMKGKPINTNEHMYRVHIKSQTGAHTQKQTQKYRHKGRGYSISYMMDG